MRREGIGTAFGTATSSRLFEKHLVSFFWKQCASTVRQCDGVLVDAVSALVLCSSKAFDVRKVSLAIDSTP
jgi:hypothetical protein